MYISIRREQEKDHQRVEHITREAFWNLHAPGCDEHYLANKLRQHMDFVAELDLVVELDKEVVANIMFAKGKLVSGQKKLTVLTFGPVSVLPEYQGQGIGSRLISHALEQAKHLGYPAVVIWGNPGHYCKFGFRSCKAFNVSAHNKHPACLLVKELAPGALDDHQWHFVESLGYQINDAAAAIFDQDFPEKERAWAPSQEVFRILSQAEMS